MFDHPLPSPGDPSIDADFLRELAELADRTMLGSGVMSSRLGTSVAQAMAFGSRQEVGLFELAADLTPGGSAAAYNVIWNGTAYVADTASGTGLVYDVLGIFRSKAGAWGFAWQGPDSPNNQIVFLDQMAKRCKATLAANVAMGTGTTTVNVDNVVPYDAGMSPTDSPSATLSVTNRHRYNALDNAPCDIVWDEDADVWILDWVRERAMRIRGTLGGALTTSTASQTVSSPVAMDGGEVPSGTLTGYNVKTTKGHAGPSGGVCAVEWNENTSHYEFYDVECT